MVCGSSMALSRACTMRTPSSELGPISRRPRQARDATALSALAAGPQVPSRARRRVRKPQMPSTMCKGPWRSTGHSSSTSRQPLTSTKPGHGSSVGSAHSTDTHTARAASRSPCPSPAPPSSSSSSSSVHQSAFAMATAVSPHSAASIRRPAPGPDGFDSADKKNSRACPPCIYTTQTHIQHPASGIGRPLS